MKILEDHELFHWLKKRHENAVKQRKYFIVWKSDMKILQGHELFHWLKKWHQNSVNFFSWTKRAINFKFIGSNKVTCTSTVGKIILIGNPRWWPSWKSILNFFSWTVRPVDSNLSGNQVNDTGPSWPSVSSNGILSRIYSIFMSLFSSNEIIHALLVFSCHFFL